MALNDIWGPTQSFVNYAHSGCYYSLRFLMKFNFKNLGFNNAAFIEFFLKNIFMNELEIIAQIQ